MQTINLKDKFSTFKNHWHPHQITVVDNMQVLLAKLKDEFVWHKHEEEDELFFVQKGTLEMHFRPSPNEADGEGGDKVEIVSEGEIIVVPKGVEHCPKTRNGEEVHVLLFEKLTTKHTGNVTSEKTVSDYPKI
ncbi:mannose-6-phosphate isomerase [Aequorivita soesokkakensis]|jgi:mannose-6-phosphate isomerase-like protein (cupin superfamily)|uniref:Mannose-6-phosphate isomerase n=1 Tax=Aequorivita soesokkakensis TaxID=1385699 RepID=A0A1A9LCH1_9FLAO|nr:cupin domain-containing protein [Aequorivita soesokkakensis]OAD91049.1 mannose-6-phosphate isomerase [Aequorivita soesokkakensis]